MVSKLLPCGHQVVTKWSQSCHQLVTKLSHLVKKCSPSGNRVVTEWLPSGHLCKWCHLVVKYATNASGAMLLLTSTRPLVKPLKISMHLWCQLLLLMVRIVKEGILWNKIPSLTYYSRLPALESDLVFHIKCWFNWSINFIEKDKYTFKSVLPLFPSNSKMGVKCLKRPKPAFRHPPECLGALKSDQKSFKSTLCSS